MPPPRSARSDMSDADMEGLQEQELLKLQRSFRNMEGDRAAYTEESQNAIRKQKQEMKQLESEKEELLKQLRLAESRSNQVKDEQYTDTLVTLLEAKDKNEEEMRAQEEEQKNLDAKIKALEKDIKELQRNTGGSNVGSEHSTHVTKKQRVLENRLDQAKKKFNDCLSQNAKLRDEIESHRNEHHKFENLYKKLEKELKNLRKEMAEIIESSTAAYDQRDDAQAKMIILKEKADKDVQQHNTEMKELVRIIDHDRKLKEFMGIKGQERQEDPQLVAWRQRKAVESEKKKESQEDSVETYEEAFVRIREMTGEDDIDILVRRFIEVEDTNFALFNYVNEQNNEIEKLNEDINAIQLEIENFKKQGIELESQRKQILRSLEEKQTKASREADEYEQKHKEVSKILDQLKAGIDSLFNKINCDRSTINDMLGAATGVTDSNMIQYLGIIEQRTNELLAIQTYEQLKNQDKIHTSTVGLLGEGPPPPLQPHPIIPPAVGDEYESEVSDEEEDEARPYTRNELQNKVLKTVKKREKAAIGDGFKYDLTTREKTQKKKEGKK
ncbi:coiled-coil domain-containing protein 63-like [Biomphalaria glabrata]|uniref:Coiled-coil domain-containing protein 63-like n=1 Tax=Biomphalaria glabrata TaxID=6526 RepID=A0A9U8DXI8_BIOGL|nr:coiled-coil domain-containing protein 63-like [Biomphalaria glabrata]XP_013064559.2 coiled-coil domain-containing protein 63-like [Biomphalaria glabrata]